MALLIGTSFLASLVCSSYLPGQSRRRHYRVLLPMNVMSWTDAESSLAAHLSKCDAVGVQELCRAPEGLVATVKSDHRLWFARPDARFAPVRTSMGGLSCGVALVSQHSNCFSDIPSDQIVTRPPPERCIVKLWHGLGRSCGPECSVVVAGGCCCPNHWDPAPDLSPEEWEATGVLELVRGAAVAPD
eukprot:5595297-Pyramimonas_sp.AAC.1